MTDKPTPTTDLLKRCAEIYEWRSTGVLSGEALRDYAKRKWPDLHDTLQMAEHETVTEALALLAKWGTPQQEAQEPVATLHCNDIGYVWARATEVGTRMRFEQPINLYTAPQPAPENIRGILARCREFIDTTKVPAYPAGADLADEIDVLLAAQPAPAPLSEREAFEAWIEKDGGDLGTFGTPPNMHYRNSSVNNAWVAWKARAALAAQGGKDA